MFLKRVFMCCLQMIYVLFLFSPWHCSPLQKAGRSIYHLFENWFVLQSYLGEKYIFQNYHRWVISFSEKVIMYEIQKILKNWNWKKPTQSDARRVTSTDSSSSLPQLGGNYPFSDHWSLHFHFSASEILWEVITMKDIECPGDQKRSNVYCFVSVGW